jgi:hypothetical protein
MIGPVTSRGQYQGMLQILQYNRRFYGSALAGVVLALLISPHVQPMRRGLVVSGAGITLYCLYWSRTTSTIGSRSMT